MPQKIKLQIYRSTLYFVHSTRMTLPQLLDTIQKACLPGIWSKGVAYARAGAVIQDAAQKPDEEVTFRIRSHDHPVSRKVTLWPEDEDWFCDCGTTQSVCAHLAAAVISLRSSTRLGTPASTNSSQTPGHTEKPKPAQLQYRFKRGSEKLEFDRWIVSSAGQETLLSNSLVSLIGGINSGRIEYFPIAATKEDFAVDSAVQGTLRGELDRLTLSRLFKALSGCSNILLDGQTIQVSSKPFQIKARLLEEGSGYRLQKIEDQVEIEYFKNGAVLVGNVLRGIDIPQFSSEEQFILSEKGRFFSRSDAVTLFTRILPSLETKITIENQCKKIPKLIKAPPRIVLVLEKSEDNECLSVLPTLKYGNDLQSNHSHSEDQEIILPDLLAEKALVRKLQNELQLTLGQTVKSEGEAAVDFVLRLQGWEATGDGLPCFSVTESLNPSFEFHNEFQDSQFHLSFKTQISGKTANLDRIFKSWRENQNYVPLLGGGWAPLPKDWLARYGERIQALLAARNESDQLPTYLAPELTSLCQELNQPCPDIFRRLNDLLSHPQKIEKAELPGDLNATLRSYQQEGVNWLCFLRNSKMGAMLSDDMGLGKTLQALCAIRGRTLVVSPTSVIHSWEQQIRQFRPSLTTSIYHGPGRSLDKKADITLTTYALLRLDSQYLLNEQWNTIILDEAQTIRNPESQVTKAAHLLQSDFKILLSGTPIENRLSDLWSQFHFLNPGLLGTLETFQSEIASPISSGDTYALKRLQEKIKPFILRRLKRDVAQDLPERTETILYCEMTPEEREVYDSLLASTRKDVLEKLETTHNVFAALELLLRLRQACCHVSLIPGQTSTRSSKIELLIQTLEKSISLGHRALVFSQWTGFLDLIEPALRSAGITFSRIDGSTLNRGEIVTQFQSESGPSVMLISLKAGGVGLTLTAADHIFLMDPWWNPAVENQAADRAHRIGQTNPVLIHRLVAENTVEDRVLLLQNMKSKIAQAVLEGTSEATSITREDIFNLLQ